MILNFVEIFKDNNKDNQASKTVAESLFSTPHEANEMNNLENFMTRLSWKERPVPEMTNNVFIQNLIINPIFINLSFQRNRRDVAENILFLIHLFATVLGTALVNLDNAPLKLRGLRLDNVFDSQEAIVKKILDRFKDESAKSIFKILGSLDIVGNPVGLFNNISTGVVDLLEKPLDGFLQGPLEGGKGLIKGTSSLVKNTVSGTFNSIGKVTCSLASGLSSLALDNEYLTQREKNRLQRPNHLGEGVYLGLNSLAKGVGYGLKGAVLDPIEGLQRGGFKGFLRGALKGFSGLFTKPVIGALDAASKTAEGIKNTANMFDQKPNDNRIRFPRAFYGKEKFYRTYMETDAEIVWLLHLSKEAQLMKDISLINAFDIFPDESQKEISFILALSYEYVLLWDVKGARTIWAINPKEIHQVTLFNDGMVIELNDLHTDKKKGKLKVKNCDFSQNEYIANKLVQLKRNA